MNSSTGGNNSEGKTMLGEWKDMIGNPATVHSCYGVGNNKCEEKNYWNDNIPNNGADLPQWVPAYRYDNPQNKIDGE